jgi:TonB family protein
MRKPIQSLSLALAASIAAVGVASGSPILAQQTPSAASPPDQALPAAREDRIENRPPDCLDCRSALPPIPPEIVRVRWLRPPQAEYPALALSRGIEEGRVTLECLATMSGALESCRVLSESPAGVGFGDSALAASAAARVAPTTVDGTPTESRMTFTVRYREVPKDPLPLPSAPPRR